jgi:enterochelin esterase-like enzyme
MNPNSSALVVVTIALAAAFFAGTLRAWPKLAQRSADHLAGRIGLLLATQLSVLAAFAAVVNKQFEFYTNWDDLLGTVQGGTATVADQAPAAVGAGVVGPQISVHATGGSAVVGGSDPSRYGEIQYVAIHGLRTGLSESAQVYLPPQYFQRSYAKTQFPAAIVIAGYPGTPDELSLSLGFPKQLLAEMHAKHAGPMVLIMVSPEIVGGRDTECTDVPGGPQTETFWAQDLPEAVDSTYRVMTWTKGWGLIGVSTGGYCSLKLAMMDSDRFAAAADISGYFDALQDHTTGTLYADSQDVRNENDLMWRIEHLPPPPVSALLTTSKTGEVNYQPTMQFAALAKAPMQVSTLAEPEGGHNFEAWSVEIGPALAWLSDHLATPRASAAPATTN